MANLDNPNGFRAIMPAGTVLPMFEYYTKSNVALAPGDAVYLLSTGVVDIMTASINVGVLGVCQSKVTAEAGVQKKVLVLPAYKDIVFSGQCSGTYSPVNAGETVDLEGTTGIMEVNENSLVASTACIRIIGLEQGIDNAVGANARVLFTWAKSQWTA
jgi:hypothetical protein